ncbi:MAG TPA: zinc-ribbon domain-containing protein [Verrucomicrobiae bacterium]|nr:zinc-ribbon domain-containing protein [Verrucomicrobiae bacterium]
MRCPRCGNENPPTNRFCGMCGTTLLQATAQAPAPPPRPVSPEPPTAAPSSAPASSPAAPRMPAPVRETPAEEPVISGPSFLGLNQPAPRSGGESRRGSLSIDPNAAPPSRNLDYLLEDDEPKRGGGGWKAVVIFLALVLAVGLGYLRWKNQGFAFLNPGAEKHGAPAADNANTSSPPTSPPAANSTAAPASANAPSSTPAASGNSVTPTTTPAATPNAAPGSTTPAAQAPGQASAQPAPQPAANPASGNPASANSSSASPTTGAPTSPAPSNPPAPKSPSQPATPVPDSSANGTDGSAASSANSNDGSDQPKAASTKETVKATPEVKPKPVDPVADAHKYLYGDGVAQNCDRGLKLLKPAADRGNAKAMSEMGALYSAGLCTPKDLPTAYRWFAMALRKEPDNNDVQTDLQKLWGEMTQPERQLAIRLSQ